MSIEKDIEAVLCTQHKRVLIHTSDSSIPKCLDDWFDVADYIKQENLAGRSVTIIKWEYV